MQQLIIKFGMDASSKVPWLLHDNNENEIIASGELATLSQLSSLQDKASNAEVIGLIPAADALVTNVSVPEKLNRKVLSAVQYMLEERLAFDVETQFIAKGKYKDDRLPVIVIDRKRLDFYSQKIMEAGLFCQKLFVDATLLPTPDKDGLSLVCINDELMVKQQDGSSLSGEPEWLAPILTEQFNNAPHTIYAYSEITGCKSLNHDIQYNYDRLPLDLLRANINSASINLLQGEFAVKDRTNATWDKWKIAAILAVVALVADLSFKAYEVNTLKNQRNDLDQQIIELVREGFPGIQRVRKATLKRTITQEMNRLETSGGSASMLAMLTQMSQAFESTGVTPQALNFNADRAELRMQSVASNFESLERFSRQVTELGLTVEQGAINNRGNQVIGIMVVKG